MNEDQNKLQKLMEKLHVDEPGELENVTSVSIFGDTQFQTVEDLELLSVLPKLEELRLQPLPDSLTVEELIRTVGELKTLEAVRLECHTMTPRLMEGLLGVKNIDAFYFETVEYDDTVLDTLRGQNHLKMLKFDTFSPLPENFLDVLSTLPQLKVLDLGIGPTEVVEPLSILDFAKKHLPNIKTLIWPTPYLSAEDIETMVSMELETLRLSMTELDPECWDYSFLNRFKSLKNLNLMSPVMTKIDWDLPNLKSLFVVDAPDVRHVDFSEMPHLKKVFFMNVGNGDGDLGEEDEYHLNLKSFRLKPMVEIEGLDSLKELESFKLFDVPTDCQLISGLQDSTELFSLVLSDVLTLQPEDIPYLNHLKNLETLYVELGESIRPSDFENFSVQTKLRALTLYKVPAPGIVKAFVSKCPVLKELTVHGKMEDEDLREIASKNTLREIALKDCSDLGAESIDAIFSMKKLESITLNNAPNETLKVQDFPHLNRLKLVGWKYLMEAEFTNLPALREIPLTCSSLESIKVVDLPNLKSLKLQNCPLLFFMGVQNVPNLSFLNVLGCPDLDLTALIRLQGLEKLEMTLDQFYQDFVLETLQELPKLRKLIIDCDQQKNKQEINDIIIKESVEEQWMSNCSQQERERIHDALPNCEIQFGYKRGLDLS